MYLSLKNNFLSFKSDLNKKLTERIIEMINTSTPIKSPSPQIISTKKGINPETNNTKSLNLLLGSFASA